MLSRSPYCAQWQRFRIGVSVVEADKSHGLVGQRIVYHLPEVGGDWKPVLTTLVVQGYVLGRALGVVVLEDAKGPGIHVKGRLDTEKSPILISK